jgi:hypothetical protein
MHHSTAPAEEQLDRTPKTKLPKVALSRKIQKEIQAEIQSLPTPTRRGRRGGTTSISESEIPSDKSGMIRK